MHKLGNVHLSALSYPQQKERLCRVTPSPQADEVSRFQCRVLADLFRKPLVRSAGACRTAAGWDLSHPWPLAGALWVSGCKGQLGRVPSGETEEGPCSLCYGERLGDSTLLLGPNGISESGVPGPRPCTSSVFLTIPTSSGSKSCSVLWRNPG